ncbi:MAG: aminoacetone oxidase family FAD-binding enzyme [Clostridia bacterium]|nr:aminoacetone oxidase family FAD-binding enzyme [Clostridia bacterium]
MSAALSASGHGAHRVAVLEGAPRVGRKILASGNGRCNLANARAEKYMGSPEFADTVLKKCPTKQVLRFFRDLGLVTVEEEGGRIYPGCGQAAAVLDVLRSAAERRGIRVLCDAPATAIAPVGGGYRVSTPAGTFTAPAVVAAFGGMAGGKLGHDGGPYRLLTDLGHTLTPLFPALTPLVSEKGAVKGLSGLRLPAVLYLCRRQKGDPSADPLISRPCQGEVLFTDYGVSGVCAMELARKAGEEQRKTGKWPVLYIDFSPMLGLIPRQFGWLNGGPADQNVKAVEACLVDRLHRMPESAVLQGLAPRLLAERLKGLSIPSLARCLAAFPVPLAGVRGFEYAQVTAGGVSTAEFSADTLESRLHPGLFAAGELLDVDGDCGGYNLQFAFASGLIAGEHAAKAR